MTFDGPSKEGHIKQPDITPEECLKLSNVQKYKEDLLRVLRYENLDEERVQTVLYDMLTRRQWFVDKGNNAAEIMKDYKPQMGWYRETRTELENHVNIDSDLSWDSNPGWFGVKTRPEAKKDGVNIKTYTTIPVEGYQFVEFLMPLARELRKLALNSDDTIDVKVPESLSAFLAHNDSIVVHFKNKNNILEIQSILDKWMGAHKISEGPREMGRTKVAADPKDKGVSFTKFVTQNISNWLKENHDHYDNEVLAEQAIKHAITQSQSVPF